MRISLLCGVVAVGAGLLVSGCSSSRAVDYGTPPPPAISPPTVSKDKNEAQSDRMLVKRATLLIESGDIDGAVSKTNVIVESNGGFVERMTAEKDKSASMRLRVPAKSLQPVIVALETIGTVKSRSSSAVDVTGAYVDLEARVKNKMALRDRLKALLDKAVEVKDAMPIEMELNRVQGEIEAMEAQMKSCKGQVDYATIDLTLRGERMLGPVSYCFYGMWWCVKKLFILQE